MEIVATKIPELILLKPTVFEDSRGWFYESWTDELCGSLGTDVRFVQDNHSYSAQKGTLRGFHFQKPPAAQSKLVRCTRGAILDVAVDIRKGSPFFMQWVAVSLDSTNKMELFIPKGFAHGFLTLTDDTEVQYKTDAFYDPGLDAGFAWNDPEVGVVWGIDNPVLSQKDAQAPIFRDCEPGFVYED